MIFASEGLVKFSFYWLADCSNFENADTMRTRKTKNRVGLSSDAVSGAQDLTYMGVEVSAEDMQKLGMAVEPKMYNGQLMIKCTKPGVAHITVKAVGGGNRPGTGSVMGGIEITKTFAVIARETGAENGGWL